MNIFAEEGIFLLYRKSVLANEGRELLHRETAWSEQVHETESHRYIFLEPRESALFLLTALENFT
jgi:hypothetical protein